MFWKWITKYWIWLFFFLLFLIRFQTTRPDYIDGQKVRIKGRVANEPIKYERSQRIILAGLKTYLPLYPEISYGDRLVVEGRVEKKELKEPELIEIQKAEGFLYQTRKRLILFYRQYLPEPHSSLVAGMVLGSKSNISEGFWQALKNTGTAHVVVASGMNVTLVAGFLMAILILILPRRKAVVLALIGVWVYAFISGFDAPIVRAAIMGSIAFSAQILGRLSNAWRALFFSVFLMLLVKPDWIYDLGFILSFTATASLMLFEKTIRRMLGFVPGIFREGFSTSLAAQIGVGPILFVTFGQFSILSPLVNGLILWTVPVTTILGMVAGLASLVSAPLGRIILFLTFPLTSWFVGIVELMG